MWSRATFFWSERIFHVPHSESYAFSQYGLLASSRWPIHEHSIWSDVRATAMGLESVGVLYSCTQLGFAVMVSERLTNPCAQPFVLMSMSSMQLLLTSKQWVSDSAHSGQWQQFQYKFVVALYTYRAVGSHALIQVLGLCPHSIILGLVFAFSIVGKLLFGHFFDSPYRQVAIPSINHMSLQTSCFRNLFCCKYNMVSVYVVPSSSIRPCNETVDGRCYAGSDVHSRDCSKTGKIVFKHLVKAPAMVS